MAADAPLLALPGGSILQFLLMTLPLLGVYFYFLYLAVERPSIADPGNPSYVEDRIRLTDILYTYLATLVLFSCLAVYLLWFVGKRRALSRRYESEAIVILGNVEYDECHNGYKGRGPLGKACGWLCDALTLRHNYGRVVYDLARVAAHPACDWDERKRRKLAGTITKGVRVYYRYPREQVSVLVLPTRPYSGQPKVDMEADWASFSQRAGLPTESEREFIDRNRTDLPRVLSRDRSLGVLLVCAFWVLFLLAASLYVVFQIHAVEDVYEDEDGRTAWIVFASFVGGGVPVVACGGNYVRWRIYERWMLDGGKRRIRKGGGGRGVRKGLSEDESDDEEEDGSSYVQMT